MPKISQKNITKISRKNGNYKKNENVAKNI